jgi:hypothetical protein
MLHRSIVGRKFPSREALVAMPGWKGYEITIRIIA